LLEFLEELECAFGVVGKDLDAQDLMELICGKIWIQNVGDIDLLSDFCH
jgi:hypothetical protein